MHPHIRFSDRGWRLARCMMCKQWIAITTLPDEPGWRYSRHADGGPKGFECDMSLEVLPKIWPTPEDV